MNALELFLICFAVLILLQPVRRNVLGVFGSIGGSETRTKVHSRVEESPITADNESIAIHRGSYLAPGSTRVSLAKNASLTINNPATPLDTALFSGLFERQQDTLEQILTSQGSASQASDERLGTFLDTLGQLSESKQSGGETTRDRTILWIVLAVVAAAAFLFRSR